MALEGLNELQSQVYQRCCRYLTATLGEGLVLQSKRMSVKKKERILELQAKDEWMWGYMNDLGAKVGLCDLGHKIRFECYAVSKATGETVVFGTTCADDFFNLSEAASARITQLRDVLLRSAANVQEGIGKTDCNKWLAHITHLVLMLSGTGVLRGKKAGCFPLYMDCIATGLKVPVDLLKMVVKYLLELSYTTEFGVAVIQSLIQQTMPKEIQGRTILDSTRDQLEYWCATAFRMGYSNRIKLVLETPKGKRDWTPSQAVEPANMAHGKGVMLADVFFNDKVVPCFAELVLRNMYLGAIRTCATEAGYLKEPKEDDYTEYFSNLKQGKAEVWGTSPELVDLNRRTVRDCKVICKPDDIEDKWGLAYLLYIFLARKGWNSYNAKCFVSEVVKNKITLGEILQIVRRMAKEWDKAVAAFIRLAEEFHTTDEWQKILGQRALEAEKVKERELKRELEHIEERRIEEFREGRLAFIEDCWAKGKDVPALSTTDSLYKKFLFTDVEVLCVMGRKYGGFPSDERYIKIAEDIVKRNSVDSTLSDKQLWVLSSGRKVMLDYCKKGYLASKATEVEKAPAQVPTAPAQVPTAPVQVNTYRKGDSTGVYEETVRKIDALMALVDSSLENRVQVLAFDAIVLDIATSVVKYGKVSDKQLKHIDNVINKFIT